MQQPVRVKITQVELNPNNKYSEYLMQDYVVGSETIIYTNQKHLKLKGEFSKQYYDNERNLLGTVRGTVTELFQTTD